MVMNYHPKMQWYLSLSAWHTHTYEDWLFVLCVTHGVLLLLVFLGAGLPVADEIVQRTVLNERGENKDEADRDEEVHGRHIGDFRQRLSGDGTQRGHG